MAALIVVKVPHLELLQRNQMKIASISFTKKMPSSYRSLNDFASLIMKPVAA
jgi:hypothetical protein